ncbi:hypothetical protein UVI_02020790 [Ustilaginoidea virens]|uniref:Uncharacterized protein n=1 Tax=Ustilaginoidea virens TaxID=1159556 RepID=A0A1B5KWS7_USTVR|nr:hypothetical protein UVI_02020790 [Ustilaginoidea virens]
MGGDVVKRTRLFCFRCKRETQGLTSSVCNHEEEEEEEGEDEEEDEDEDEEEEEEDEEEDEDEDEDEEDADVSFWRFVDIEDTSSCGCGGARARRKEQEKRLFPCNRLPGPAGCRRYVRSAIDTDLSRSGLPQCFSGMMLDCEWGSGMGDSGWNGKRRAAQAKINGRQQAA